MTRQNSSIMSVLAIIDVNNETQEEEVQSLEGINTDESADDHSEYSSI